MATRTGLNEGLFRFGGMFGAAYNSTGELLTDVVEVSGAIEVNRLEVPIVGSTKQGYKPGRETREGSISVQKVDTEWEWRVYNYLNTNLSQRRKLRDEGKSALDPFTIVIGFDDPDALDTEQWQLEGCLIWRLPLGFSITDDIVNREFPLTWERERPLNAFKAVQGNDGAFTTTPLARNAAVVGNSPVSG